MTDSRKPMYLDNGATSFPKPPAVEAAMSHFLLKVGGSPGRSGTGSRKRRRAWSSSAARRWPALSRGRLAAHRLHAQRHPALNTAIYSILKPGDRVLTTAMEHDSTMRPLRDLEHRGVISLEVLPCDGAGRLDLGQLAAALQTRPRLLAAVHASNVSGAIVPLREVGAMTRAAGTLLLVDAAQSAGASRSTWRPTVSICWRSPGTRRSSGRRAPAASGHERESSPSRCPGGHRQQLGARGAADFWPDRLESGTQNAVGIAGLLAGVSFIAETGLSTIREREEALTQRLLDGLSAVAGITLYGPSRPPSVRRSSR